MSQRAPAPNLASARQATVAVGASLVAAHSLLVRPFVLIALLGLGVIGWMVVAAAGALMLFVLSTRNLADEFAGVTLFAGMNPGALLGAVVVGVAAFRLAPRTSIRGFGIAVGLLAAFIVWGLVGVAAYGFDDVWAREVIRLASIVGVALIVANSDLPDRASAVADGVILAATLPAVVALIQLAQGVGFEGTNRVYGTLAHPSTAGAVFAVVLALALWRLQSTRQLRFVVPTVLFSVALLATQSLGGMAQIIATLLAYAFFRGMGGSRGKVAAIAAVALVVVFVLSPFGSGRVSELQETSSLELAQRGYTANSLDWRFLQWTLLIDLWQERPYFGHGLGATNEFAKPQGFVPHNDVLRVLVETGVAGLALFVTAFGILFSRLRRAARESAAADTFPIVILAIVVGLTIDSFVNNILAQTATMYMAAALVAVVLTRSAAPAPSR